VSVVVLGELAWPWKREGHLHWKHFDFMALHWRFVGKEWQRNEENGIRSQKH